MILSHPLLEQGISFEELHLQVLIAEEQAVFRGMVSSLHAQADGNEGDFRLYDQQRGCLLSCSEHLTLVTDYMGLSLAERRFQHRLQQYFRDVMYEEMLPATHQLRLAIEEYLQVFAAHSQLPVDFDVPAGMMHQLLKAFGVTVALDGTDPLAALLDYLNAVNFLFSENLSILVCAGCYFGTEDVLEINRFAQSRKSNTLLLDCCRQYIPVLPRQTYVIDRDLCAIYP